MSCLASRTLPQLRPAHSPAAFLCGSELSLSRGSPMKSVTRGRMSSARVTILSKSRTRSWLRDTPALCVHARICGR